MAELKRLSGRILLWNWLRSGSQAFHVSEENIYRGLFKWTQRSAGTGWTTWGSLRGWPTAAKSGA